MKIKRFTELNEMQTQLIGSVPEGEKILKGTLKVDFEVLKSDILESDYYGRYYGKNGDDGVFYSLLEYVKNKLVDSGDLEYQLVDGKGNVIEDEDVFDDSQKFKI